MLPSACRLYACAARQGCKGSRPPGMLAACCVVLSQSLLQGRRVLLQGERASALLKGQLSLTMVQLGLNSPQSTCLSICQINEKEIRNA